MRISEKLTPQKLYEIANNIRQIGETNEYIDVTGLVKEIQRQIIFCYDSHNENK